MAGWLRGLLNGLPERPKAIVIVSAHWEAPAFAITGAAHPELIFDYYGFPKHTYQLTWPAPGAPALAERIRGLLAGQGLPAEVDPARGFDHGVFIPFKLMVPAAEIPTVQLSLQAGLDPATHLAAGRALAPLRDEGVLIVGSGMSFHNMRAFGNPAATAVADEFDGWLTSAVESVPAERAKQLEKWADVPSGRLSHPREEHLLPLMVAAGAAGEDGGRNIFSDIVMSTRVSGFQFG
jgi:aromatic ring-opening dioxygenase catalytic subunit (LigB family)